MSKKKTESDYFISTKALVFRLVFGFLALTLLAATGIMVGIYFGFIGASLTQTVDDTAPPGTYYVGVGRSDVTGPVAQVNMMGYANPSQIASGLHQRLYARAFVVSDISNTSRVAFVTVDSGMASQIIKLEVVKKLQARYGKLYSERNVVISGTHSHSGPAGFFQTMLVEVTSLGAVKQTTNSFIDGIYNSIVKAHSSMTQGHMYVGSGDVVSGNINRSPSAYLKNPENERIKYNANTEHKLTMLKFLSTKGAPIGMFTWYPVHGTSMNFSNGFISSDNRGRASALFENMMRKPGEIVTGNESYVGAFASANLGDVSPRTKGPICIDSGLSCDFEKSTCGDPPRVQNCVAFGPGTDMFDSTDIIAKRQLEAAKVVYNESTEQLIGSVGWVHQYVDMTKAVVQLDDGTNATTCKPGMGYSFAAGTTDGAGAFDFTQSMTQGTLLWDAVRDEIITKVVCSTPPPKEYYDCHHPKPVLLPTGYMDKPYAWQPTIIDIQMLKLGQLIIIAVPGEFTTMAGRRIKDAIKKEAMNNGVSNPTVVLAGLSNVYTHYITTPEEYTAQRYEGASTIFGPHTFTAYYQKYSSLVKAMITGNQANVPPGPSPPNILSEQVEFLPPPGTDVVPEGRSFGDVITDVKATYKRGDKASVTFYGANPRHNMKIGSTYLAIEQMVNTSQGWKTVYVDTDWSTIFNWTGTGSRTFQSDGDKNVITALFNVIARSSDLHFDYEKAMMLYQKGELNLKFSLNDVVTKGGHLNRRHRAISVLQDRGVLSFSKKPEPLHEVPGLVSLVTIDWWIPDNQPSGTYRIIYFGDRKDHYKSIIPFTGHSSSFKVVN